MREKTRAHTIRKMWHNWQYKKGKFTYICIECGCIFTSRKVWYQACCYSCAGEDLTLFVKGDWIAKTHPALWKKLSLLERKKILRYK